MPKASKKTVEETPAGMGKNLATMPAGPGAPMEILFSFDTTRSMSGCIAEVCQYCAHMRRRPQGGGARVGARRPWKIKKHICTWKTFFLLMGAFLSMCGGGRIFFHVVSLFRGSPPPYKKFCKRPCKQIMNILLNTTF